MTLQGQKFNVIQYNAAVKENKREYEYQLQNWGITEEQFNSPRKLENFLSAKSDPAVRECLQCWPRNAKQGTLKFDKKN